jgi:site-specific recombinase XerD
LGDSSGGNCAPTGRFNLCHLADLAQKIRSLVKVVNNVPKRNTQKSGYVFGNGEGGHIGDVKHSFTSACRKAGITDFRFHDLRHTYASHLAMRGVHIRALQELLGHKTLIMTQRYSHLAPERLQNAVKLLDAVIGEKRELGGQAVS